jgi:hypothetical protein
MLKTSFMSHYPLLQQLMKDSLTNGASPQLEQGKPLEWDTAAALAQSVVHHGDLRKAMSHLGAVPLNAEVSLTWAWPASSSRPLSS